MIEVSKGVRGNAFRLGDRFILDISQDSNFPIPFEATTGGLVFSARKHFSLLD
jgi:hypothetical protein